MSEKILKFTNFYYLKLRKRSVTFHDNTNGTISSICIPKKQIIEFDFVYKDGVGSLVVDFVGFSKEMKGSMSKECAELMSETITKWMST